jgi:hypothetical protein
MMRQVVCLTPVLLALMGGVLYAQEAAPKADDVATTLEALKQRNKDLERRLADLEQKIGESPEGQQMRQQEIRAIAEKAVADMKPQLVSGIGWLDNLKFSGDMRLRYEYRDKTSDENRDERARLRLRFGFEKAWPDEDLLIGFRLATGEPSTSASPAVSNDPTSANQSFVGFQKYSIWIDRAYAQWTPKMLKGFSITAGKIPNPWETSDLVWDPDINPDGVWLRYNVPNLGPITPFVGAGAFQLYAKDTQPDSALLAYDAGVRYQINKDMRFTSAVTFYNYQRIDSAFFNKVILNPGGNTTVGGHLVSGYETLDFVNKLDFVAFGLPMNVFIDWAHNTDPQGLSNDNLDGLAIGLKVGANKKKGDWSAWYVWKNLEADAVLASFAESDFGWNTFTNRRGSQFGVAYNITDSLTAGATVFVTQPINAKPNEPTRFTLQADLVWKF